MDDATWDLVSAERRTLADLLEGLSPAQWEAPSLCAKWRVRDVAAHLAMTPVPAPDVATMTKALVRNRGHLWNAGQSVAVAYAERPYEQITRGLRTNATSRSRPVFVSTDNILPDLVIHGQDIAIPLGLERVVPPVAGRVALERIWGMGWPFYAQRRLGGFTLHAGDCDWFTGSGPEVIGTSGDLLLIMTGRTTAALDRLHGAGVASIRDQTATAQHRNSA